MTRGNGLGASPFRDGVSLKCPSCGRDIAASPATFRCPSCGSLLEVAYERRVLEDFAKSFGSLRGRGVWRYSAVLPLREGVRRISLGEGSTPLIELREAGGRALAKYEGANPTGSFKDRGMTVGMTLARAAGYGSVVVASTGNTAASAAAYAARAGLRCLVVVPRGKVAAGKLAQVALHGAEVIEVDGYFDRALEEALSRYAPRGAYPLNSVNPWRLEGQKTLAFEVFEEIGVPDAVVVPVGNAGNIYAIWKGFAELVAAGLADRVPRMVGVQASGAAPLASAWRAGLSEPAFVDEPKTVASAIRIGRPVNWPRALRAVRSSGGTFVVVEDDEILRALAHLARREGIGVEPASAAALAGYWKALEEGAVDRDEVAVLVLTGSALKDPAAVELINSNV
ncbi:MAG: threonine synthase [Desulfurococcaceae archaeon]